MRLIALAILVTAVAAQPQEKRHVNRLAKETSPYLLQHKHNPVDWYPWGKEAIDRAKRENKAIFLSIGYSACHWCHVMEHESFENEKIAALMNKYFVNIKVDREERPDLDDIYMAAVQAMTGAGGWPMSVFMTPDLQPFFGGTYFPPADRHGRAGFPKVLEHVQKLWKDEPDRVKAASKELSDYLAKVLLPKAEPGDPALTMVDAGVKSSSERFDAQFGGFGRAPRFAPKFPHASELSALLRHHVRTGDKRSLELVETTLERMAKGGIYDQIGGGFHRYSVDRQWLVPHFEKMLYDNSLLTRTYLEAHQITGKELYARIARETLDYLIREMQDPKGGIWSTTDADSEGEEGKFFVWQKKEVAEVVGAGAAIANAVWGITDTGNWEHKNILTAAMTVEEAAKALDKSVDEVRAGVERARAKLYEHRGKRVPPLTDDKVLAEWNGMAIAAFALGYQILEDERYLVAARRAANFVLTDMRKDGRLLRTWRIGAAKLDGYLDDYAFMADGLLSLYECDFDPRWLREAKSLLEVLRARFRDPKDGNFFHTADDHEKLIVRNKSANESSTPSGVAMAVMGFLRAGLQLGDEKLYDVGVQALRANHMVVSRFPMGAASLLLGIELHLGDPREVVIVGEPTDPTVQAFLRKVRRSFPPHRVVTLLHAGNREALVELAPLFKGKDPVDGKPAVYVCRRGACEAPVVDPAELKF